MGDVGRDCDVTATAGWNGGRNCDCDCGTAGWTLIDMATPDSVPYRLNQDQYAGLEPLTIYIEVSLCSLVCEHDFFIDNADLGKNDFSVDF
ncbi:hypothetical protein [Desulfosediminicola sp.]|uniref:hypothetical protein n=1 Tax=Desulfosediminicola sp. TaxID=2886825 RepID=UPI003AF2CF9B